VGDAVIDGGGPLPPEFPDALSYLMEERHMTDEGLAALTCLSSKTIWRLRNGKNEPKCPTVIALCIGLSLDPYTGKSLVEIARIHLGGGRVDRLYQVLLGVAYGITIYEANAFMKESGCPPLTANED
jgi:transcriptional regulator with XRE-family HTH domain